MIPVDLLPFANHLWQSTLFAGAALLLTLALSKNRAQLRYWLWMAASVKFLIPFSLLVTVGNQVRWGTAPDIAPPLSLAIEQISQPFAPTMPALAAPAASPAEPVLLLVAWLCGCGVVLAVWWVRWRLIRTAVRAASPLPIQAPIAVMSSPMRLEPGVFGVFRPVLLLPEGIANRLTPAQLRAILAHEMCHVRRRDNLAAAVHMVVEAIFWFHPLVWWIGSRLIEERERACDEEVVRLGSEPQAYAEGILNVCKFYLESPLACTSGVTGADLKKRIEAIMTHRISHNLTLARKLLLATAATMAVTGPILIGIVNSPRGRAQSKSESLTFEVASIKPAGPDSRNVSFQLTPGGGLNITNLSLKQLIAFAYDIPCGGACDMYISGGPGWIDSQRFDILAKAPQTAEP
ncbi:MAG: M56 family metallopeptidase, partial [Verrucomicrobia subdivision 3 bacterium]|nr:M56 family metallopeptidase [Limisphaerales bacterium]